MVEMKNGSSLRLLEGCVYVNVNGPIFIHQLAYKVRLILTALNANPCTQSQFFRQIDLALRFNRCVGP